jgi:hypothetical protein
MDSHNFRLPKAFGSARQAPDPAQLSMHGNLAMNRTKCCGWRPNAAAASQP